jgi:hypothetical protein
MHFLFQRHLQSMGYRDTVFEGFGSAMFHPEFDGERFMEAAKVLMNYILANRDELFVKPYIIMFGEDLDMDWTCFLSVNAGASHLVGEKYGGGDKVCGFMLFDPTVDDDVFQNRPIKSDDPYLFFLTLARHVLNTTDETQPEQGEAFNNISEFTDFFSQAEISFGAPYEVTLDDRGDFNGDQFFVQLAIPKDYPIRLKMDVVHYSKLAAILFFIDFCSSVAEKEFRWAPCDGGGGINAKKPLTNELKFVFTIPNKDYGFGNSLMDHIKVSKNKKKKKKNNRDLWEMSTQKIMSTLLNSLVILIDRIACTGILGEGRTLRNEYTKLLRSRGADPSSAPAALYVRFTDRAHAMGWEPRVPVENAAQGTSPIELTGVSALLEAASQSPRMPSLQEEPPHEEEVLDVDEETLITSIDRLFVCAGTKTVTIKQIYLALASEYDIELNRKTQSFVRLRLRSLVQGTVKPTVAGVADNSDDATKSDDDEVHKDLQLPGKEDVQACHLKYDQPADPPLPETDDFPADHDMEGIVQAGHLEDDQPVHPPSPEKDDVLADPPSSPMKDSQPVIPASPDKMEIDVRLSQLEIGQPVPLELDLLYEGFEEGLDNARPISDIADKHSICPLGSLPAVNPKPHQFDDLDNMRKKKSSPHKKRTWTSKDVAVGPMQSVTKKVRASHGRISKEVEEAVLEKAESSCVAGDQCCLPGGSTTLDDLKRCASCSRCKSIGHFICLKVQRKQRYCPKCFQIVQKEAAIAKARAALVAKRESKLPHYLEPPAELLSCEKFVRPNITSRMRETLDCELLMRNFSSEREMRDMILAHNSKLEEFQANPELFDHAKRRALKKDDTNMKRQIAEWTKCHRKLREAYVKSTRCCVKALRYNPNKVHFVARMEWEESALNIETGEEITVLNSEKVVVRDEWVKENFTTGTYAYLKLVSARAKGKFMPVPNAHVAMDTRQISHMKWAVSPEYPDGRWIVRFANSDETEEMKESDLKDAVGEVPMIMAKSFASGKGGFIPIPVGNSTEARAVQVIADVVIFFQQHDCQTCIYSSFASALWFIGITDVANLVVSEAKSSEGDPFALKRLAKMVHDHPTWLIPQKIKSAATSFNLLQHDLKNSIAVVVLKGIPDGACNHAITVFDGMIFDSNEKFAIPLTRPNLDLMCSTDTRQSKYSCVAAGYTFSDSRKGQTGIRDSMMKKYGVVELQHKIETL